MRQRRSQKTEFRRSRAWALAALALCALLVMAAPRATWAEGPADAPAQQTTATTPITPTVTRVVALNKDGKVLANAEGAALELSSITEPTALNAWSFEVTLEATELQTDIDVEKAASYVALIDAEGAERARAAFAPKLDAENKPVANTYVATLDHLTPSEEERAAAEEAGTELEPQPLPDGTYALKIVASDKADNVLKTSDELPFVLVGAKIERETEEMPLAEGTVLADGTLSLDHTLPEPSVVEPAAEAADEARSAIESLMMTPMAAPRGTGGSEEPAGAPDPATTPTCAISYEGAGTPTESEGNHGVKIYTYSQNTGALKVVIADPLLDLTNDDCHAYVNVVALPALGVEPYEADRAAWVTDAVNGTHTYTDATTFARDGRYRISVAWRNANDEAYSEGCIIVVDSDTPTVSVAYPQSEANQHVAPSTSGTSVQLTKPEKVDFFDHAPTLRYTFSDRNINPAQTTFGSVTLAQIEAAEEKTLTQDGITYVEVSNTRDDDYVITYVVDVTYGEGTYEEPLATVVDESGHTQTLGLEDPYGVTAFVVDLAAPEITSAGTATYPYARAVDSHNNVFVYNAEDALELQVTETRGLYAIRLEDPSGRYTLKQAAVGPAAAAGNAPLETLENTGPFTLQVVDLLEGSDFSDSVTITFEDFAGNWSSWLLTEQGPRRVYDPAATEAPYDKITQGANPGLPYITPDDSEVVLHPTLLVVDTTAPELDLSEIADRTDNDSYVRYFNTPQDVTLNVTERNLRLLRGVAEGATGEDPYGDINTFLTGADPTRKILTITSDVLDEASKKVLVNMLDPVGTNDGEHYQWTTTYSEDGTYQLDGSLKDLAGNVSATVGIPEFVIDLTKPVMELSFANDPASAKTNTVDGITYVGGNRTATVTMTEKNFAPERASAGIAVTTTNAEQGYAGPSVPTSWSGSGSTHEASVTFDHDGQYTMSVDGNESRDMAGNPAAASGSYATDAASLYSGIFVVDTENPIIAAYYDNGAAPSSTFDVDDPAVEFPPPTGTYDGVNYYAHAISLYAQVKDRNLDPGKLTLAVTKDGTESTRSASWGAPDGRGPNGYELYQTTVAYEEDGEYLTPHVTAADYALNTADNDGTGKPFVIDLEPPEVKVNINNSPASQGKPDSSGDPINFYNESTTLTLKVSDKHKLRSVELVDPDGNYTVSSSAANAEGKGSVTLTVTLKDGTAAKDAEYQRDIVLTAIDLAGNERTWTIDHTGTIVSEQEVGGSWKQVSSSVENAAVDGEHPIALVQDTVAPVVSLSGVKAGEYYNSAQTVVATVNELNFDYLMQFDPARTIVTATKYEGNASRAKSTYTLSAADFAGSKPNYTLSEIFDSDGHYVIEAQFRDFATNLSNKAVIGEFTIDMTDPVITIEFDNNDVRNGMYYKAPRTATITVEEHNFDPDLIKIETNGALGSWSSNGDTHTITVYFGEGGPYNLTVSGKDLAGNEAQEQTVDEFIVDLTAPEVTIAGTAQRLGFVGDTAQGGLVNAYHGKLETENAYNGVVVPTITYKDNEVLSAQDLSFALAGSKHGEGVEVESTMSPEDKEMTVTLADLGYQGEGAPDGHNWEQFYVDDYAVDADDIYTLSAKLTDQAGNEAEAEVVFSVNRYGSTYDVHLRDLTDEERKEYKRTGVLSEPPTIVVREVNVSGVLDRDEQGNFIPDNHRVEKEFANATTPISWRQEDEGLGYSLRAVSGDDQENGWSEYTYTIRSANFGEGSDSDHDDRGQGVYRVNVTSDDASSNANTTADYWRTNPERTKATESGATAEFILDELGPAIDDVNLPEHLSAGGTYEASFHVTDDITSGNTVEVYVDGKKLGASRVQGPSSGTGTFTFNVEGKPFNWARSVRIVVRDYAGRESSASNGTWFWQSTFLFEAGVLVMALAACAVVAFAVYRSVRAAEPELPDW